MTRKPGRPSIAPEAKRKKRNVYLTDDEYAACLAKAPKGFGKWARAQLLTTC